MSIAAQSLLDPALLERVQGLALIARRVVEGALHGLHRSPRYGMSIEFAQHREYTPGDEIKHLDWRVLGRSDRLVVKQYQQETNLRAVLFVDCSRSMAFGGPLAGVAGSDVATAAPAVAPAGGQAAEAAAATPGPTPEPAGGTAGAAVATPGAAVTTPAAPDKLHYAKVLAAALGHLLLSQGDSVGLVLTSYKLVAQVAPRATPGHLVSLCQLMANTPARGFTDLAGMLRQFAGRLKRRSLILVFSDLFDDPDQVLASLGQLTHRGHEVIVFQVLDPRELSFDLGYAAHGVTVIRDMESGEEFEAEPQLIRDLVRDEVRRFCEHLDNGARRHHVQLVRCTIDTPPERVLTTYLHQRLKARR